MSALDAELLARVRKVFETTPGWRSWDPEWEPAEMLAEIAEIIGEPTDQSHCLECGLARGDGHLPTCLNSPEDPA